MKLAAWARRSVINIICLILLFAGWRPAFGEMPSVRVPENFYQCKEDKDCAVAGDACRSCGNLIVINRKHLKRFNELDQKERRKKKVVRACEACSTKHVILKCVENKCQQEAKAP